MTRSYTPSQIADGLLAGEFTRDSAFVPLAEVERLIRQRDELLETLKCCRAVLPQDRWADDTKKMIDIVSAKAGAKP